MVDVEFFIELIEGSIVYLMAIVYCNDSRQAKDTDSVLPNKVIDILLSDSDEWLDLYLLSEVVDYHYKKLSLSGG